MNNCDRILLLAYIEFVCKAVRGKPVPNCVVTKSSLRSESTNSLLTTTWSWHVHAVVCFALCCMYVCHTAICSCHAGHHSLPKALTIGSTSCSGPVFAVEFASAIAVAVACLSTVYNCLYTCAIITKMLGHHAPYSLTLLLCRFSYIRIPEQPQIIVCRDTRIIKHIYKWL